MSEPVLTVLPVEELDLHSREPAVLDVLPVSEAPLLEVIPVERPGIFRRGWDGVCAVAEWLFGAASLMVGLAILASMPVLQFLTLGYLLEAAGRVARTGRLRDGFLGVRPAARVGSIVIGAWVMLLPLRLLASLATSAQIIDPGGVLARRWDLALQFATGLIALHIVAACARGGKLRHFLWPFNPVWLARRLWRGGYYAQARDAVWDFVMGMRLPYFFWLGLRGFIGTLVWLAIPVSLIALGRRAPVVGFLGAFVLAFVLLHLPFLQMRFAVENRFRALFELRSVRANFRRAPWAFAFALSLTLAFAVPLYLLKIEMIPREAAWLPSLVFIVFIFPARLATGWAYGRSLRREQPRHWFFRWTSRLWIVPVALLYVLIVFFTQYITWDGIYDLYYQHAFLVPAPFMGM